MGCDVLLCIRIYFTKHAFQSAHSGKGKEKDLGGVGHFWNTQAETIDEMKMRLRKVALCDLFSELFQGLIKFELGLGG